MRSTYNRIKDHLAGITLPQVASLLGPAWRADGLRLTGPQGEGLDFDLSWHFDTPELVIVLESEATEAAQESARVSMAPTARPERIVRELRSELLPSSAHVNPEQGSAPGADNGQSADPGGAKIHSKPVAA